VTDIQTQVDVVVVGSGIAGLTFALRMADRASVLLITKKNRAASSTNYARGGIAAVFGDDDEMRLHVGDTLLAGAGLCHRSVVEMVVREGPARIRDLVEWGTRFDREGGSFSLGREGGHSHRRIVHAGDRTGRAIETALLDAAAQSPRLEIVEDLLAVDLRVEGSAKEGSLRCSGLIGALPDGRRVEVAAGFTFLATGGCGQAYRHTTNPGIATGDGTAMAYRAGARIANMEFIQFHPTALHPTSDPAFLVSEAVRGEGATLRTLDGRSVMEGRHPAGALAPRDVVARTIHAVLRETGDDHVLLDCSGIPEAEFAARFPAALKRCQTQGIDPWGEGIPVVPAAHYLCGGVQTDTYGRSSLPGLLAAGEVACTGLHGANRLASNSLLEAVVVSHRAATHLLSELEGVTLAGDLPGLEASSQRWARGKADPIRDRVRDLMWNQVGIVRRSDELEEAEEELQDLEQAAVASPDAGVLSGVERANLATVSRLIVASARSRPESRGLHFLEDSPWRDNEAGLTDTVLVLGQDGEPTRVRDEAWGRTG